MATQSEVVLLKRLYGIESRADALGKLDVLRGAIVTLTKQVADVETLISEMGVEGSNSEDSDSPDAWDSPENRARSIARTGIQ